ncbi:MAG: hypothetical protein PUF51_01440 [Bifidobacteriaceae bacterium]|nr:hypothetical protein [Bifidobacteriaceae bacterium]
MSLFGKARHAVGGLHTGTRKAIATVTALAALAGGAVFALADGDDKSVVSNGGVTIDGNWLGFMYHDNNDGGWGKANDLNAFKKALDSRNINYTIDGGALDLVQQQLNQLNADCSARFDAHHPDREGQSNCRLVGVGVSTTPPDAKTPYHFYNAGGDGNESDWATAWRLETQGKTYYNNGQGYKTYDAFSDNPSRSVDSLAREQYNQAHLNSNGGAHTLAILIAVDQSEPKGESKYNLSVSTQANKPADLTGGTAGVSDAITTKPDHDNQDGSVTGTVWLTYVGARRNTDHCDADHCAVGKQVTLAVSGTANAAATTQSPQFTPSDLGMAQWEAGAYWFDTDVPQQKNMSAAASQRACAAQGLVAGQTNTCQATEMGEVWVMHYTLDTATQATAPHKDSADRKWVTDGNKDAVSDTLTLTSTPDQGGHRDTLTGTRVTLHYSGNSKHAKAEKTKTIDTIGGDKNRCFSTIVSCTPPRARNTQASVGDAIHPSSALPPLIVHRICETLGRKLIAKTRVGECGCWLPGASAIVCRSHRSCILCIVLWEGSALGDIRWRFLQKSAKIRMKQGGLEVRGAH